MNAASQPGRAAGSEGAKRTGASGMSEPWCSFTCPVCGHRDSATLEAGSPRRVACAHCDTVLELDVGSSGLEHAAARVVTSEEGLGAH